jgi:ankyrin repeat protein
MRTIIDRRLLLCGSLALIVGFAYAQSASTLCEEKISEKLGAKFRSGTGGVTCPEYLLHVGISFKDIALVELAIRLGASAESARNPFSLTPDKNDMPPLYVAVLSRDAKPEIVRLLVKEGASVNARYSPNIYAAANPTSIGERIVLNHLKDEEETDRFPLFDAVTYSNPAVIEELTVLGADVQAVTGKFRRTALFATDNIATGDVLIRHGIELNKKDRDGATVLSRVRQWLRDNPNQNTLRSRKEEFLVWLLSKGAHD